MFQFPGFPAIRYLFTYGYMILHHVCSHIRKSAGRSLFAAHRSLSQLVTSFVGSWCQGIPLALLLAWPIKNSCNCSRCELCRQFFREIVIVTHLYDVPQLKYTLLCLFRHRTSLLPYFTLLLHCSVFKVHCPITFAIRFEDPTFQSGLQIQQQMLFGGPEWARTTDLAIISRTL